jgi:hypothetical protein
MAWWSHRAGQLGVPAQHVRGVDAVRGVQVERHVQAGGPLPDHPQLGVVQVAPLRVRVDQRAPEPEPGDRALQLPGGGRRVLQRQRGEPGEPGGVLGDGGREQVVHRGGPAHGERTPGCAMLAVAAP